MNKLLLAAVLSASSIALIACTQDKAPEATKSDVAAHSASTPEATSIPIGDTPEVSLDWPGTYEGILPCASCEGIRTELKLNNDKTYELTEEYLGEAKKNESTVKGNFTFDTKNLSIIHLDDKAEKRQYLVGENFVEAREFETGNKIESSANYQLNKK